MNPKQFLKSILLRMFPRKFGVGSGIGWLVTQRKWMIDQAFMYIYHEIVEGDYLEFGVARGRTLFMHTRPRGAFPIRQGK